MLGDVSRFCGAVASAVSVCPTNAVDAAVVTRTGAVADVAAMSTITEKFRFVFYAYLQSFLHEKTSYFFKYFWKNRPNFDSYVCVCFRRMVLVSDLARSISKWAAK